jgi:hypothetical protein
VTIVEENMMSPTSPQSGGLWFRVQAEVKAGTQMEAFAGLDRPFEDSSLVEFARASGDLTVHAATEPYAPMTDPQALGQFIQTFGPRHAPASAEIVSFHGRFGKIADAEWIGRLYDQDRKELPELTRQGLREPIWRPRELAPGLALCCELCWGLRENRVDILQAVLGSAPSSGKLVDMTLLAGELRKVWASENDLTRRVGSI